MTLGRMLKLSGLALPLVLGSCYSPPLPYDPANVDGYWYCDTPDRITNIDPQYQTTIGLATQPLYLRTWQVWPTREIPVCWEDDTLRPEQAAERALVQQAVAETWEAALCGGEIPESECLRFVGWNPCSEGSDTGVRIRVDESGPRVDLLGFALAGRRNGMKLNFTFNEWSERCLNAEGGRTSEEHRLHCIRAIAVHEFGHVLGLAHEQNRDDRPECPDPSDAPQGPDGNAYLGPWDQNSIMNYCSPEWNNGGVLSPGDRQWIRVAYYPQHYDHLCVPLYVWDPSLRPARGEETPVPEPFGP